MLSFLWAMGCLKDPRCKYNINSQNLILSWTNKKYLSLDLLNKSSIRALICHYYHQKCAAIFTYSYCPTMINVTHIWNKSMHRAFSIIIEYWMHFASLFQAAGRHQCTYLINLHTTEFILQNGDEKWLKGLSYIPQKLRDLYEINKILAHRPWLITKEHIEVCFIHFIHELGIICQ